VSGFGKFLSLHWAADNAAFSVVVALLLARGPTTAGFTPLVKAEACTMGPGAAEIKALLRAAMR
jgi:hypothetical protein